MSQCVTKIRSKVSAIAQTFRMLETGQAKVRVRRRACAGIRKSTKTLPQLPKRASASQKFLSNHVIDDAVFDSNQLNSIINHR